MNSLVSQVIENLMAKIEAGGTKWKRTWSKRKGGWPANAVTGNAYKGVNVFSLMLEADDHGWKSSKWATYKQWKLLGRQVTEGAKSTRILFFKRMEVEDRRNPGELVSIPMLRVAFVFNEAQLVDYVVPEGPETHAPAERHAAIEKWHRSTGMTMNSGKPCYIPSLDVVNMPPPSYFTTLDTYWLTLLHEAVHWSGAKSRLDRNLTTKVSEAYAFEEIVAEVGSVMLGCHFQLEQDEDNHASYLSHWINQYHGEKKKEIFYQAVTHAEKAAEYLIALGQQQEKMVA